MLSHGAESVLTGPFVPASLGIHLLHQLICTEWVSQGNIGCSSGWWVPKQAGRDVEDVAALFGLLDLLDACAQYLVREWTPVPLVLGHHPDHNIASECHCHSVSDTHRLLLSVCCSITAIPFTHTQLSPCMCTF